MWEHHNHILHGAERAVIHLLLKNKVRVEFDTGFQNLPRSVRQLTKLSLATVLKMHPHSQQAWVQRIQAARVLVHSQERQQREEMARQHQQEAHQRLLMMSFFQPK